MPRTSLTYRALLRAGVALAPLFAARRPKLAAGLAARHGVVRRMAAWAARHRDPVRPLLWMHAASVGEGLQAQAVLQRLRAAHPDWQIIYTYFSPSARELAGEQPADYAELLPLDLPGAVEAALAALAPTALVFSKLDLWPELATAAARRGVAVGLIAATVSPTARRLRWPARVLLRPGYRALSAAGAITAGDAERLLRLGVMRQRLEITGDPRFDSALARAQAVPPDDPLLRFASHDPVLVAGSTWPEDEAVLLDGFRLVRQVRPEARLLLVPHEPEPARIAALEAEARRHGFAPARFDTARGDEPLLVVDRVGILATLYAGAFAAYVGGGFGTRGLHSVLEPAACGVPVLFGPHWQGSPDAGELLRRRAAAVLAPGYPDWLDLDTLSTWAGQSPAAALWLALLRHPAHVRAAGRRALAYVEAGVGAAGANANLVERLLEQGRLTTARG